jgi:pimeloyl-ACP methyl ester carboxylesterase
VRIQPIAEGRLKRPDGRVVAWAEYGSARGRPILRLPGTPGSRYPVRVSPDPWIERNIRMIVTERPGFGASTRLPDRGFHEHADDLAAILDEIGADALPIIGGSGGGPPVLALAGRHPTRVVAATIISGMAPLGEDDLVTLIPINAEAHQLATAGDFDAAVTVAAGHRAALLADPLAGIRAIMATAPASDQAVMADRRWQRAHARATREALRQGPEGWVDEGFAMTRRFGEIDLRAIRATLTWWHADGDRNTPFAAAKRLVGRLPTATLNQVDSSGHLWAYHREGELLDELLSRA